MRPVPIHRPDRSALKRVSRWGVGGVLMLSSTAFAAVIHSTFGVGYTYDNGGFYTAFDFGAPSGVVDYDLANRFSTGSSAYVFESARLGVTRTLPLPGDNFTLRLMTDAGGAPGAVIETIDYTDPLAAPTPGGTETALVTASGLSVLAANTTYWIAIGSTFPDSVSWWRNGVGASSVGSMAYAQNGGSWQFADSPSAFEVNGRLVAPTVNVPEPGSLALVVLAVAAGAATRRRR